MKIYSKLFLLGLFYSNGYGTTAFVVQPSNRVQSIGILNAEPTSSAEQKMKALEKELEAKLAETGSRSGNAMNPSKVWETTTPILVQGGGALRTWSFANPAVQAVEVLMKTEGRPLEADVELWQGPDNTPFKMKVYVEDCNIRTFNAMVGTPRGPNTVAIRNIAKLEFPLEASLLPTEDASSVFSTVTENCVTIQGGALRTYNFDPFVESVAVLIMTDGRPLNSRIELLQGPNNIKQVIDIYTEDGLDRPFFAVFETPGSGNVVRVVNTAPVEFPMTADVQPYVIGEGVPIKEGIILGGNQ